MTPRRGRAAAQGIPRDLRRGRRRRADRAGVLLQLQCRDAGRVLGQGMNAAEREGRIGTVDIVRDLPVHTAWDLGVDDTMAIWCFQVAPGALHIVDYYESAAATASITTATGSTTRLPRHRLGAARRQVRELGSPGARSRIETLVALGRKPKLVPQPQDPRWTASTPAARRCCARTSTRTDARRASRRCAATRPSGTRTRACTSHAQPRLGGPCGDAGATCRWRGTSRWSRRRPSRYRPTVAQDRQQRHLDHHRRSVPRAT